MLSVFMFDMINKEYHGKIADRFKFTAISHKAYLLYSLMMFTAVMSAVDLMGYFIINSIFDTEISFADLVLFRIFCNAFGFLLTIIAGSLFSLYRLGLMVTVILLSLHMVMPLASNVTMQWLYEHLHPIESLMAGSMNIVWTALLLIMIVFWRGRGTDVES